MTQDLEIFRPAFDNATEGAELTQNLHRVFEDLDKILVQHCGPFASNAVIGSRWRQHNDVDEFTKDGIKIFRHLIVSDEGASRFAARMARYVGIAVDNRCHDGTTTSMLLFCRLTLLALKEVAETTDSRGRYLKMKEFKSAITQCLDMLGYLKITEDDLFALCKEYGIETTLEDVRAAMAYHMAMISAKGDDNLSSKIAEVVRSCPKKIYGMFKNSTLSIETKEPYTLKKQDYDLAVNANLGDLTHYNYKSDTQYLSEDAVIFCTSNHITMGSWEGEFLRAFISEKPEVMSDLAEFNVDAPWAALHGGKRNLIILCPVMAYSDLMHEITSFNRKYPDVKISYFHTQVKDRMKTSFKKTLHYMAGVPTFESVGEEDTTNCLIGLNGPKVKAHFVGSVLTLTNLYEKDGEVYHPLYRDPEAFPPYTRFVKETEELMEFAMQNVTNPALDQDELSYLTMLYRALTCQEIYDIEVGGSMHDQYANGTVYEDAMGAALSAVNDGIVLGGYAHLAKLTSLADPRSLIAKFAGSLYSIVCDSLRADSTNNVYLQSLIKDHLPDKWSFIAADMSKVTYGGSSDTYIQADRLTKEKLVTFLERKPGTVFLLQAYTGYEEQFNRCGDIITKLINTTQLVDMRIPAGTDVS
jgi:hypothetical protein